MSSAPFEEGFSDLDSGYMSAADPYQHQKQAEVVFTPQQLKFINSQLQRLEPQDVLRWCITSIPNIYQETALGLSGLVILDMLSKIEGPIKPEIDTIFIDTLHHFDETLDLLARIKSRYTSTNVHVYKPEGVDTADEFAARYGKNLWQSDEELYDYKAKVEPTERAYSELNVTAAITGRRKTQGGKRGGMNIIEVEANGLIKVNPLANWTFDQVADYVHAHDVPYNELLDRGYKSIGDWHSTQPVAEGEDERAGRWRGTAKTECGIHNPKSRYAQYLAEQARKEQQQALDEAFKRNIDFGLSLGQ